MEKVDFSFGDKRLELLANPVEIKKKEFPTLNVEDTH